MPIEYEIIIRGRQPPRTRRGVTKPEKLFDMFTHPVQFKDVKRVTEAVMKIVMGAEPEEENGK